MKRTINDIGVSIVFWLGLLLLSLACIAPLIGEPIYWHLGHLCHQDYSRTFKVFGLPFGICCRCAGIYLGIVVAYIVLAKPRNICKGRKSVILLCHIIAIFSIILKMGHIESTNSFRFIAGIALGVSILIILDYVLEKLVALFGKVLLLIDGKSF